MWEESNHLSILLKMKPPAKDGFIFPYSSLQGIILFCVGGDGRERYGKFIKWTKVCNRKKGLVMKTKMRINIYDPALYSLWAIVVTIVALILEGEAEFLIDFFSRPAYVIGEIFILAVILFCVRYAVCFIEYDDYSIKAPVKLNLGEFGAIDPLIPKKVKYYWVNLIDVRFHGEKIHLTFKLPRGLEFIIIEPKFNGTDRFRRFLDGKGLSDRKDTLSSPVTDLNFSGFPED